MMRGVGGPLLCIGDLLSDLGDDHTVDGSPRKDIDAAAAASPSSSSLSASSSSSPTAALSCDPSDLHKLFEDKYSKLVESLEGNDHSWTSLTLELCAALKTANSLVTTANSNIESLVGKVEELEKILKRGDNAVATATAIQWQTRRERC